MSELRKTIFKKSDQKLKKQKIKVRMQHVNKGRIAKKRNFKQKTRPRMKYEWIGKTIRKKI